MANGKSVTRHCEDPHRQARIRGDPYRKQDNPVILS
jgi:hypothetical protein